MSTKHYKVKGIIYSTPGITDGYCQFTGGGDIVIEAGVPLTIVDHLDPSASLNLKINGKISYN